jgi:hypothetical protein
MAALSGTFMCGAAAHVAICSVTGLQQPKVNGKS